MNKKLLYRLVPNLQRLKTKPDTKEGSKILTSLIRLLATTFGLGIMAVMSATFIKIMFITVPLVFMGSLMIGLGARNWGRCL
jgi:hypothetical protein